MNMDDLYPSKYVKADDLEGRTINVVIANVVVEEIGKQKDRRPVVYFQGAKKGMVLNKTNAKKIAELYGKNIEAWTGREIALFSAMVEYQGDTVPGLRVRAPEARATVAPGKNGGNVDFQERKGFTVSTTVARPVDPEPSAAFADDEIPF